MKTPMTTHLKVLACLLIGFHIAGCLFGIATITFGSALVPAGAVAGSVTGSTTATVATTGIGALMGGFIAAFGIFALIISLPGVIAGWGLLTYRPWARTLTIILSILNVVTFPLGTALGVYGLLIMFNPECEQLLYTARAVS
jgi:hypothetical protein